MKKQVALMFILSIQPVFAVLIWFSMDILFGQFGLEGAAKHAVAIGVTAVLYLIFCHFFARGFLASGEARKLGF